MLLKWNGDLKFLPNFKFRRFINKKKNEKQREPLKTVTTIRNSDKETSDAVTLDEKMEVMES